MKKCSQCGGEFPATSEYFQKAKANKDGFRGHCRECRKKPTKEYNEQYREENKEAVKKGLKRWRQANKERIAEYDKQYRQEHLVAVTERIKRYHHNNKKTIAEVHSRWKEANKGRISEKCKQYRQRNLEAITTRQKHYVQGHLEEYRIYNHNFRAKMRNLPHTLTLLQWEQAKLHFDGKCAFCSKEGPMTQEHFVAVDNGGEYTKDNIIPSCGSCNSSKWTHDCLEWYRKQPFYNKDKESKIVTYLGYKKREQQLSIYL